MEETLQFCEFADHDAFFHSDFRAIVSEIMRILKYVVKIELAPADILPKIAVSLENFSEILAQARKTLEEIQEKKQQVLDYVSNYRSFQDSLQAHESLQQAYKQKFKEQDAKLSVLQRENEDLQRENGDLQRETRLFQEKLQQKDAEFAKLETEKECLKRQVANISSVLKQMSSEKQALGNNLSGNQKNNKEIELAIRNLREELEKTQQEYAYKLKVKENLIESLQRRLVLLEKDNELNEEWKFLQEKPGNKSETTKKKAKIFK